MTVAPPPSGSAATDSDNLQTAINAGGSVYINDPAATYLVNRPLRYGGNTHLTIAAKLVFDSPGVNWPTTFLMGARSTAVTARQANVTIDMSPGGKLIGLSSATPTTTGGQHGLQIGFTDGYQVISPWVQGENNRNLYALLIRKSNDGIVKGGYLSHRTKYQGADGIHFVDTCRRAVVTGVSTASFDDGSSLTLENTLNAPNSVIEDITFRNCSFLNFAHSSIKGLIKADTYNGDGSINTVGTGSIIRRVAYYNCDLITIPGSDGTAAPISFKCNLPGATIEDISVHGGRLRLLLRDPTQPITGPLIDLVDVSGFSLRGTDCEFFGRRLLRAIDCPDLTFRPSAVRVVPGRTVSTPTTPTPLVQLTNCPGYDVDTAKLVAAYPGQTLLSAT